MRAKIVESGFPVFYLFLRERRAPDLQAQLVLRIAHRLWKGTTLLTRHKKH